MNTEINTKGLKIKDSFSILLWTVLSAVLFSVAFKIFNVDQTYSSSIQYIFSFGLSLFVAIKIFEKYAGKYCLDIFFRYLRIIPLIIPLPYYCNSD